MQVALDKTKDKLVNREDFIKKLKCKHGKFLSMVKKYSIFMMMNIICYKVNAYYSVNFNS